MGKVRRSVWTGALLLLAGCATLEVEAPNAPPVEPAPTGPTPPPQTSNPSGPQSLSGWADEDHLAAFQAYAETCRVARDPAGERQCQRAQEIKRLSKPVTPSAARAFFEAGFAVVEAAPAEGRTPLLTAYFAPEYSARHTPDAVFDTPVLGRPEGWTRGWVGPDRAAIEAGSPPSPPLAWMRAEDLFFLQIQGSGYLTFEDGSKARAAYAADNGRPFTGIARPAETT